MFSFWMLSRVMETVAFFSVSDAHVREVLAGPAFLVFEGGDVQGDLQLRDVADLAEVLGVAIGVAEAEEDPALAAEEDV